MPSCRPRYLILPHPRERPCSADEHAENQKKGRSFRETGINAGRPVEEEAESNKDPLQHPAAVSSAARIVYAQRRFRVAFGLFIISQLYGLARR